MFGNLINLINLLQVLVSADRRYGPLYSWGTAGVIARTLTAHGYRSGSGAPVTLIGYSGGAQIALGAARYLGSALGGPLPLQLIALGGMMSADPGLDSVEAVYQLAGTRDRVPGYGARYFPGRWPIARHSPWNRAHAAGKIHLIQVGPAHHHGRGGYFDPGLRADGRSLLDRSVETTVRLVTEMILRHGAADPSNRP